MPFKRIAAWYLLIEGIGGIAWWITLFVYPVHRSSFMADGSPDSMLLAFLIPDALLFVGGAFLSAYLVMKPTPWAFGVLWLHAGAVAYAALYCWGLVIFSKGDGMIGALMMTPPLIISLLIAITWRDRVSKNVR